MKHKIPCYMIRDLLPLYTDGLTCDSTVQDVEEHLESCPQCRESYKRMKADFGRSLDEGRQEARREINYLKAVRSRNLRNTVCAAAAAVLVLLAGIGVKLFVIGFPSDSYVTTYVNVDEEQIHVGGIFAGSGEVYGRHKVVRQNDGTQKLVVYSCLASGWNRKGVFNLTLDRTEVETQIDIGGTVVKQDGSIISRLAGRLYEARNPYIGDMPANGRLAGILGIGEEMGGFTSELQTSKEPYGWTLKRQDSVGSSVVFEARMKDYGCVLLALIDNLGEISWTYTVETENGAVQQQTTLTTKEASQYLEGPVKAFGESPEKVQELLDRLDIS